MLCQLMIHLSMHLTAHLFHLHSPSTTSELFHSRLKMVPVLPQIIPTRLLAPLDCLHSKTAESRDQLTPTLSSGISERV